MLLLMEALILRPFNNKYQEIWHRNTKKMSCKLQRVDKLLQVLCVVTCLDSALWARGIQSIHGMEASEFTSGGEVQAVGIMRKNYADFVLVHGGLIFVV